ncbi:hypothetical protein LOTGIDRAFT_99481, partial [Lottia gigantea]
LVLGKSRKPRCFSKVKDINQLPVTYRSNEKAWMTSYLFEEWMDNLNKKMKSAKRH